MVCSIDALKYVNFPTRELGKSCKVRLIAIAIGESIFFDGNSPSFYPESSISGFV